MKEKRDCTRNPNIIEDISMHIREAYLAILPKLVEKVDMDVAKDVRGEFEQSFLRHGVVCEEFEEFDEFGPRIARYMQ